MKYIIAYNDIKDGITFAMLLIVVMLVCNSEQREALYQLYLGMVNMLKITN